MFCPNCGNNCGDARFCSSCGTKLQQAAPAAQSGEWKVGMPCPHCGGTQLNGHNCAFCGSQLIPIDLSKDKPDGEKSVPFPYGLHEGVCGYLELKEEYLILCTWTFFRRFRKTFHVPYKDLKIVKYKKGRGFESGFISIRWGDNTHIPVPQFYRDTAGDPMSLVFFPQDEITFERIYCALQDLIDQNNRMRNLSKLIDVLGKYVISVPQKDAQLLTEMKQDLYMQSLIEMEKSN